MLTKYNITDKKVVETDDKEAKILVYSNPDEHEKKQIINDFDLDEHTIASALDPEELSRLEFEDDYTVLILSRPKNYTGQEHLQFKIASIGIIMLPDKLLILTSEKFPLFLGKRFRMVQSLQDLCMRIIYDSIYHYMEHLRVINMISEEIERKLNKSMENKYLLNMFSLEKSLVYYYSAINANGMVFEKIRNAATRMKLTDDSMEMLDDILVENRQCLRQAEIYSNVLASLMDARASIVNNNLNQLMKTLNFITIGIMVPTFVVSAFSMNVRIPLQSHHNAFWIVMLLAFISVIIITRYGRYKKW